MCPSYQERTAYERSTLRTLRRPAERCSASYGTLDVTRLEAMARAAGLLGKQQQIQHAKAFKKAKRSLGIRSVRAGFGSTGKWAWLLPVKPVKPAKKEADRTKGQNNYVTTPLPLSALCTPTGRRLRRRPVVRQNPFVSNRLGQRKSSAAVMTARSWRSTESLYPRGIMDPTTSNEGRRSDRRKRVA